MVVLAELLGTGGEGVCRESVICEKKNQNYMTGDIRRISLNLPSLVVSCDVAHLFAKVDLS